MVKQTQTYLMKVVLSAAAVFLLRATIVQSATVTVEPETTATPVPSLSFSTTQLDNSSMDEPQLLRSHRPCGNDHLKYCQNGGQCMYPQDNDRPSCICTASYGGPRCMFIMNPVSYSMIDVEQLIGICVGVAALIFALILLICCCHYKRRSKSSQLIKATPSDSTV